MTLARFLTGVSHTLNAFLARGKVFCDFVHSVVSFCVVRWSVLPCGMQPVCKAGYICTSHRVLLMSKARQISLAG
jgi:hypothetical protein